MSNKIIEPLPIDTWEGRVEWIEEGRNVFISHLFFPSQTDRVDYVEEVEISTDQLSEQERGKLRNFLTFTCTVELDESSVDGIKEVRDIAFLPPTIITPEMVAKAAEEFAFLSEIPE